MSQHGGKRRPWWICATMMALAIRLPPSSCWTLTDSSTLRPRLPSAVLQRRLQAVAIDSREAFDAKEDIEQVLNRTPLSLTLEELSNVLGGKGRAQACWDCFRLGVDPLWFYDAAAEEDAAELEPMESALLETLTPGDQDANELGWSRSRIQEQITPRRRSQGMGRDALKRLERAFSTIPNRNKTTATQGNVDSMASIAKVVQFHRSLDGTTKLLLQLTKDGLQIECVIIPWPERGSSSLCLSNQIGCAQACTCCSTGRMGELRSLTADEILVQMYWAAKVCRVLPDLYPVDAIVFMGMGEAARNVDHVVRAASHLVDPQLFQLAPRRVTISTVAPSPKAFEDLGDAPAVLAWSVHASEDTLRKKLVPTTKHSMAELRDSLIRVLLNRPRKLRQIMLELALIDGINDRPSDAEHLVAFCQKFYQEVPGVKLVVNLIPWNDISATSGPAAHYRKPTTENVLAFQKVLVDQDILCYVRTTRGDDESAACGQLATKASRRKVDMA